MELELYKILQHGFVEHVNSPNRKENAAYALSKVLLIIGICSHILSCFTMFTSHSSNNLIVVMLVSDTRTMIKFCSLFDIYILLLLEICFRCPVCYCYLKLLTCTTKFTLTQGVLSSQQILRDCGFMLHVPGFSLKSLFRLRRLWSQLWE